jgi:hypothetical protein
MKVLFTTQCLLCGVTLDATYATTLKGEETVYSLETPPDKCPKCGK